jgi:hypothetical protein
LDNSAVGQNVQRVGIRSVGKGVMAEDLEKMRELNRGAQIEEEADNVMALTDERRRTKLFQDKNKCKMGGGQNRVTGRSEV